MLTDVNMWAAVACPGWAGSDGASGGGDVLQNLVAGAPSQQMTRFFGEGLWSVLGA